MTVATQFELNPDWVRVHLTSSTYADFHYFWLRHNCPCLAGCRHEKTKERTIDAAIIPLDIRPLCAESTVTEDGETAIAFHWAPIAIKDDTGKLVVPDEAEHKSVFSLAWLKENAYGVNRTQVHELPPHNPADITIDYSELAAKYADAANSTEDNTRLTAQGKIVYKSTLHDLLKKYGVVVVRNRGSDTEDIIYDFVESDNAVIPTHFGRIEHLRTDNIENANNDQLGYTNSAVRLHTDQCYSEHVPGFQFLHCIRPADIGGDNYFVHAESAANYLKTEINSRAYELLTSVPVRFDRKQSKFQALHVSPILRLSDEVDEVTGERKLAQVRYSYFTQAAQNNVPFSELREWYEAQRVWDDLLYRDDFQLKATLQSGDFVIYDNLKVLHARNGFQGPRHMAGVYLNAPDLWAHLQQAKKQLPAA